jgi:hypothetical protein
MTYIECDLNVDETLNDFRKRTATPRRRWWQVAR